MRHDKIKWRNARQRGKSYEYLFDGDQHQLAPGSDITTIPSFRVMLHRICAQKGLRYRTQIVDGNLWVEMYRETPGDLYQETYGDDGSAYEDVFSPADAPPAP